MPFPAIEYRRPSDGEVPLSVDIYLESLADMRRRHGLPPIPQPLAKVQRLYWHIFTTGIYLTAWVDGEMAGVCHGTVRDGVFFLSGFWIRPHSQNQGIGRPLLQSVIDQARAQSATIFVVWSSIDTPAMATYMKLGMLPGTQILVFRGIPTSLPDIPSGYSLSPLAPEAAGQLDCEVRGTPRLQDHQLFHVLADGYLVRHGARSVGYFYLQKDDPGMIGPAAWAEDFFGSDLLSLAFNKAASEGKGVSLATTGQNHCAIRHSLACGLRISNTAHCLVSRSFGAFERYLPSGPLLF
jgi:GNAT superfamily N-acetyltransferase